MRHLLLKCDTLKKLFDFDNTQAFFVYTCFLLYLVSQNNSVFDDNHKLIPQTHNCIYQKSSAILSFHNQLMAANLPDVFLLSVFKKLSANDRLISSQVCSNWYYRVREVNKTLRCLTITVSCENIEQNEIEQFIFGYSPCIKQQLIKDQQEEDQEKFEQSTKFNTLHLDCLNNQKEFELNFTTVNQIIAAFPATTELNLIVNSYIDGYKYLVHMLESGQSSGKTDWNWLISIEDSLEGAFYRTKKESRQEEGWSSQLTTLRLKDITEEEHYVRGEWPNEEHGAILKRLFATINGLPALQRLAIDLFEGNGRGLSFEDHKLTVLSRLKEVRYEQRRDRDRDAFIFLLEKYAFENVDLKIDFPVGVELDSTGERFMGQREVDERTFENIRAYPCIHERIVRLSKSLPLNYGHRRFQTNTTLFPNLISIIISFDKLAECAPALEIISEKLLHLRHLQLRITFPEISKRHLENDLNDKVEESYQIIDRRPSSALLSVTALELDVTIFSHSDLQWLNFPQIVPNVQVIHFNFYNCKKCNVTTQEYSNTLQEDSKVLAHQCFAAVFQQLSLSFTPAIPLEKITFVTQNFVNFSAKQILLE